MPHQCVKCSRLIAPGSRELLEGCKECGGHFFFYIRDDQIEKIKEELVEIPQEEKKRIEKDIREMAGITDQDAPIILDIESVRATGEGKFELDLVKLFQRNQPLIYKIEEGKYVIDLASTLSSSIKNLKEIRNPEERDK
ncbi:Zn-ribbon domain-containing protein [Patescibacteria group bacterium]|nr:Zn-ribbon domain-containing protein [Patescibacteria group bacterium]